MTRIKTTDGEEVRVILCISFEAHAPQDKIQVFGQFLIGRQEILHTAEVEGDFDYMFEAAFPDLAHFHDFMGQMSHRFAPLMRERRSSFVCRRYIAGKDRLIWVPVGASRVRVDLDRIDRVTAEGDYVRLHVDGAEYLYHATMHALEDALDPRQFVRVHRSAILRLSSISYFRHDKKGWLAECADGSVHRIARAHRDELIDRVSKLSATQGRHSANLTPATEKPAFVPADHPMPQAT